MFTAVEVQLDKPLATNAKGSVMEQTYVCLVFYRERDSSTEKRLATCIGGMLL